MPFQIVLNILLAIIWVLLWGSWSLINFAIGYAVGALLIFALRGFIGQGFYLKRLWAGVILLLVFAKEIVHSNIVVMLQVLRPRLNIKPGIVAVPIEVKNPWEITILASLITMTPGTLTLDLSDDNRTLYVHAMNVPDTEKLITKIKQDFEARILEVFR